MPTAKPEGAVPVAQAFPAPAQPQPDDDILDMDAFAPTVRWMRRGGIAYRMRTFYDIDGPALKELWRLEQEQNEDPGRGIADIRRRMLNLIAPDMPEHVLQGFTLNELIMIIEDGWKRRPLVAVTGAPASPAPPLEAAEAA
jgi:hypothetical protein